MNFDKLYYFTDNNKDELKEELLAVPLTRLTNVNCKAKQVDENNRYNSKYKDRDPSKVGNMIDEDIFLYVDVGRVAKI